MVEPGDQGRESRILADRIDSRIDAEKQQPRCLRRDRLVEPLERGVVFVQRDVDVGKILRGDVVSGLPLAGLPRSASSSRKIARARSSSPAAA